MNASATGGRKQRAVESRSRIYSAALEVISEKGFEEAGIKDIVERAGVSVGAFYHYFDSKEAILEENFKLADERFALFHGRGVGPAAPAAAAGAKNGAARSLSGETAAEMIIDYLGRYGHFVQNVTGIDLAKRIYTPKTKLFVKKGRPMQTVLAGIIQEAIASGELRTDLSAERACEWLFIGARGVAFHWCLVDGNFDLELAMREYARRSLRAIEPLGGGA